MGNCQRFALQGRIELRGLSGQHLLGIEGSREPPHLHARSGMACTPGLHQDFGGSERGAGDAGSVRRLVAAEQHKVNTAIGQRLKALGGGADVAAHGSAHVALQQGFGAAGVAVDQPAGTRRWRHRAALGLLG